MALEEPSFCKLSRLLTFDCAGIERLSVPQPNCYVSLGESICIAVSNLVRAHQSAHSALSGSSWADTPSYRNVLYPRGAVQLLETMAIALDRRLVRLCRHLSKNINCEAERWRVISWRFSSGKTANSRVFCRYTQIYRRTQTLNPPCAHAHRVIKRLTLPAPTRTG